MAARSRTKKRRKTPPKTPNGELRVPAHGNGALKTGNPGNKGGTGRPPNAFQNFVDEVASHPELQRKVRTVLTEPNQGARDILKELIRQVRDGGAITNADLDAYATRIQAVQISVKEWKGLAELVWAYSRGRPRQGIDLTSKRSLGDILSGEPTDG